VLTQLQEPPRLGHHADVLLPGSVQLGQGFSIFPSAVNNASLDLWRLFVSCGVGKIDSLGCSDEPYVFHPGSIARCLQDSPNKVPVLWGITTHKSMTDSHPRLQLSPPMSLGSSSGFVSPLSRPRSGPLRRLSPKRSASYRTAPVEPDKDRVRAANVG
jgi:hypothetical protein